MRVRVMVTEGGPHAPETTALECASALVSFDAAQLTGSRLMAAERLRVSIAEALLPHHEAHGAMVREELSTDAAEHFARGDLHDPSERIDQALADVQAAADATEWAPLFRDPATVPALRQVIGQYLVDVAHMHRLWHAQNNPEDTAAQAYASAPTGIAVVGA